MQPLDMAQSAQRVFCILSDSFQTWDDLSHEDREGWMRVVKFVRGLGDTLDSTPVKDVSAMLWDEFSQAVGTEPPGQFGRLVWEGVTRHIWALMDEGLEEDVPLGTLEGSWLEWLSRQKLQRQSMLHVIAGS